MCECCVVLCCVGVGVGVLCCVVLCVLCVCVWCGVCVCVCASVCGAFSTNIYPEWNLLYYLRMHSSPPSLRPRLFCFFVFVFYSPSQGHPPRVWVFFFVFSSSPCFGSSSSSSLSSLE